MRRYAGARCIVQGCTGALSDVLLRAGAEKTTQTSGQCPGSITGVAYVVIACIVKPYIVTPYTVTPYIVTPFVVTPYIVGPV